MQTQDLAPYYNQLSKALGSKIGTQVTQEELTAEFENYLRYGVPPEQAVKTILRHHGVGVAPPTGAPGAPSGTGSGASGVVLTQGRVPLAQLPPASGAVHLKARILSMSQKQVTVRGEPKDVISGLLGDESGVLPFTSWRPLEGLQKGDVIEVIGAYTKDFRGAAQVNIGDRARINRVEGEDMPRPPQAVNDTTVAGLKEGMRGVKVTGRILDVAARTVTVQGAAKTVWGGTLADASGHVEFSSWSDHGLQAGQAVTIEGAYVRAFRNVPQLTFDAEAKVTPAETPVPEAAQLKTAPATPLSVLQERGSANDITVVGTLLEIRPGSGLIFRCPAAHEGKTCGRVVALGACRLHGKQEGTPDLRIKCILDDGTGAVSLTIGRELTERLLGKTLDQAKAEAQAAFRPDLVVEQLKEKVTGHAYQVQGFARSDDYGLALIAKSVTPATEDVPAAAKALLDGGAF